MTIEMNKKTAVGRPLKTLAFCILPSRLMQTHIPRTAQIRKAKCNFSGCMSVLG